MRMTRFVAAAVFALAAISSSVTSAASHPGSAFFTGTAFNSGMWLPAAPPCGSVPCPSSSTWSFSSSTDVLSDGTVGSARVSAAGTFAGWCEDAAATASVTFGPHGAAVTGRMVGKFVVLTGGVPGHTGVYVVMVVKPSSGTGNCVTAPATAWDAIGIAAAW